ncbi:MAG: Ig-like domain-containing protein [Patescibacteria group bacterium]|nr:Ig-like domain-containing protein [Patescibacteria group bacterium]
MAIRFSKKFLVITGIVVLMIMAGIGGYIVWRLNQEEEVTPEEAQAGCYEDCMTSCEAGACQQCYDLGETCPCSASQSWIAGCPAGCNSLCGGGGGGGGGGDCGAEGQSCCDDDATPGAAPFAHGCNSGLHCLEGGSQASSSQQGTCEARPSGSDPNCNSCEGSCDRNGCRVSSSSIDCHTDCGMWPWCAYCRGRSHSACGELHDTYYHRTNGSISYAEEYWCSTIQCDSNAPNGAYVVVYIGDRGEYCVEGTGCDPDDLDWDCDDVNVCDAGDMNDPASGSTFMVGDTVRISGWAGDTDGIDTSRIQISIDGTFVGNATGVPACPDVRPDVCAVVGSLDPTAWTYDWVATAGDHTISAVWYDSLGVTGADCEDSTIITVSEAPTYLDLDGGVFCQDENGPRYPVVGASVSFYQDGSLVETLTTDSAGLFSTVSIESGASNYSLKLSRALPERTLSTGVSYSDMVGPEIYDPSVCTAFACDCSATDYDICTSLTSEGSNSGFRWLYTECDLAPPNSEWGIEKIGVPECFEEGTENVYAEVDYAITIEQVVTGDDYIEYVEDTFDPRIDSSWIISTIPEATTIDSEKITWVLGEGVQEFTGGYVVRIPQELFGEELHNEVVAHLSTDEDIYTYEDIFITCAGPGIIPPAIGDLPGTGIFDNVGMRLTLGAILVALAYGYYKGGVFDKTLVWLADRSGSVYGKFKFRFSPEGKKKSWEGKVVRSIDKKRKS